MNKLQLPTVTLIIIDCVDVERAKRSFLHCTSLIDFADAKLLTHEDHPESFIQKIEKLNSISEYSNFIIRKLDSHFDTQHVLVAQWDGFVRYPQMWDNRFLQFDYIGAPWPDNLIQRGIPLHFNVGNGGFSLRSKRLQNLLSKDMNLIHTTAEDVTIAQYNRAYLESKGIQYAPLDIADKFSWEFYGPDHMTFGVHARIMLP